MKSDDENILVRSVNWLGDAVMTTPALQRLREARPEARITLLCQAKLADLWRHHPGVDEVLTLAEGEGLWAVAGRLRSRRFDTAILFPNSLRAALEVWLARIPRRVGLATNGRAALLTDAVPRRVEARRMHKRSAAEIQQRLAAGAARETYSAAAHHVRDYLHLVAAVGADPTPLPPILGVTPEELTGVRRKFSLKAQSPLVGLNAGAEYGPAKRWPAESFVAAALALREQTGCDLALFGGKADREAAERMAAQISAQGGSGQVTNLAGQTSLRELCASLQLCDVLLTNDTGPMHVAAAVGTPVVVPFGSTSPELTGPSIYGPQHQVVLGEASCAPCFLRDCPVDTRCLRSISVSRVVEAASRILELRRKPTGM